MAITQSYCDFGAGNDYIGASFTDGSFANATLTLTKAGAFAASSVGHWLYLDDNGSGEVTTGYYRITDVSGAPNAVVLHADIRSGANDPTDVKCTQHDGTALLPYRSIQGACDLLTRDTTDGNQVNLKAGTAQVNAAALDLDEVIAGGALSRLAPLIIRGYTAAANDGGIGEIDCGGATMWAAATYDYVHLVDLKIHTFGDNNGVVLDTSAMVYRCEIHKGASNPSTKALLKLGTQSTAVGCYIHDPGASGQCLYLANYNLIHANYISTGSDAGASGIYNSSVSTLQNNVILCGATGAYGIRSIGGEGVHVIGNICYNTTAGTTNGILLGNAVSDRQGGLVINNIVVGWSGAGGIGIYGQYNVWMIGHNAFYNNTTALTISDQKWIDETVNDVALGADPFTSASTGDFSLTAAAQTALADKGFPIAYYGAHANTVSNLNIGPIQPDAGGTSGVIRRVMRLLGG